jgi:hypothetical protein
MKLILWLLLLQFSLGAQTSDWTWAYRKRFSGSELENLAGKAHLTFVKTNIPKFKQLIFSWNAHRPKQGYFTFYVQTRNAASQKWSNWYKIAEWGSAVQRSHLVKFGAQDPENVYVRLEQPWGVFANGFRLKVEAHGQAKLSGLRSLNTTTCDLNKFKIEPVASSLRLKSKKVWGVPKLSQMVLLHDDCKKMCSPTATAMLVGYLNNQILDPIEFARSVYDHGLGAYGSWPFNVAHAFEICPKYTFRVVRLNAFSELYQYLQRDLPVVVSVRGYLPGAPQEYRQGHLLIVVGWDQAKQSVICHDPAIFGDDQVEHVYNISHFLRAWESSHRLAYVAD